ncbi:hypothetical protein [Gottfriedia acidiceleris]|uniref:hypothetical protein n=1 Tax=Gottfriedia acidiceleris TaxID=371036 RepID=UPI003D1FFB47
MNYKLTLNIIKYSIFWTILLFITAMYLPDTLNISERLTRWVFEIVSMVVFIINYQKWKQLLISFPIGMILLMLFIVLFVP